MPIRTGRRKHAGKTPASGERRRADRRGAERIEVQMWVEEQEGDVTYFQRSANLSAGGIFLDHTPPHPKGTRVMLGFVLPGETHALRIRGEVLGTLAGRMGMRIRFVDLDEGVRKRIAKLVRARARS